MTVYVRYLYPIYAEVDLDERDVVRVIVDDESPSQPVEVLDTSLAPVASDIRAVAIEVAESSMWPSWDYGW
jgi:hypothetical protein